MAWESLSWLQKCNAIDNICHWGHSTSPISHLFSSWCRLPNSQESRAKTIKGWSLMQSSCYFRKAGANNPFFSLELLKSLVGVQPPPPFLVIQTNYFRVFICRLPLGFHSKYMDYTYTNTTIVNVIDTISTTTITWAPFWSSPPTPLGEKSQ